MSKNQPSDPTQAFYERNATDFKNRTCNLDVQHLYPPFLTRLEPGARILDAGCGPGRDLKAFTGLGYDAVGMDASENMVRLAREHSGREVHHLTFQDITWDEAFDGIWACAALLHVPRKEMRDVLQRLERALKPGGVLYVSFKYGPGDRVKDGRLFTDYTEESFQAMLHMVPGLVLEELWRTQDVRQERADEGWLNAVLRRKS